MAATSPETGRGPGTRFAPRSGEKTSGLAPRFSVALCTYNGARFLPAQLGSLAGQTLLPAELVVRDDGSSDETIVVLEAFRHNAPFPVRVSRNPMNLGVTQNFAAALAECRGDLIALCDQDDVWLPGKLQAAADFLAAHPELPAVCSEATLVDESLQPLADDASLWRRVGLTPRDRRLFMDRDLAAEALAGRHLITGATLVLRRELLAVSLPIPGDLPAGMIHDGWIALTAAATGGVGTLPQPLVLYRQHGSQQVGVEAMPGTPGEGLAARFHGLFRRAQEGGSRAKLQPLATSLETLHGLLTERLGDGSLRPLQNLARRAAHVRTRADLPGSRFRRPGPVVRELLRGCYHRYCHWPLLAALGDLAL